MFVGLWSLRLACVSAGGDGTVCLKYLICVFSRFVMGILFCFSFWFVLCFCSSCSFRNYIKKKKKVNFGTEIRF